MHIGQPKLMQKVVVNHIPQKYNVNVTHLQTHFELRMSFQTRHRQKVKLSSFPQNLNDMSWPTCARFGFRGTIFCFSFFILYVHFLRIFLAIFSPMYFQATTAVSNFSHRCRARYQNFVVACQVWLMISGFPGTVFSFFFFFFSFSRRLSFLSSRWSFFRDAHSCL